MKQAVSNRAQHVDYWTIQTQPGDYFISVKAVSTQDLYEPIVHTSIGGKKLYQPNRSSLCSSKKINCTKLTALLFLNALEKLQITWLCSVQVPAISTGLPSQFSRHQIRTSGTHLSCFELKRSTERKKKNFGLVCTQAVQAFSGSSWIQVHDCYNSLVLKLHFSSAY